MKKSWGQIALLVVILVFILPRFGFAQDEQSLLKRAIQELEAENTEVAQEIIDQVRLILWNKASMRIENVVFTESETTSYGAYQERISNFFAPGETIYIYAEPKNYTIYQENGIYHIYFTLDVNLYDQEGSLIVTQESFANFRYITYSPVYEVFLDLYFDLDFDPGEYELEVIVQDQLSDKSASFRVPIRK